MGKTNVTSISSYKKHRYSGPIKSRKAVRGQLKRHHHNEGEVSRDQVWRKKTKTETTQNEAAESASQSNIKTYSKQTPIIRVEACFDTQKIFQPSTNTQLSTDTSSKTRALDINWPVTDPTLASHELTVGKCVDNNLDGLTGNRIVDMQHVLRWAFALGKHMKTCASSTIEFVRELRSGFHSIYFFKCSMCDAEFRESNANSDGEKLNTGFVWGTITGGGYYTQTCHLTNVMDIPTMGAQKFRQIEKSLGDTWKDQLTEEIKKVGTQERSIAIQKGQITSDGIPYIEVVVDGGWAKRSYGHNYNSASGMACIIGKNTRKCLYIGIKNKYCYHCYIYEKKNKDVPPHKCFKNYQGSSTSMEAEILVEGFKKSEEMHGLQYLSFVGDGDSSVFSLLKENVPYGQKIKKTECKNHVIKNYTSALYKILANTKLSLYGRKMLKARLSKLTVISRKIIMHHANDKLTMRSDLQHGPSHVFGQHDKCKSYFCKYITTGEQDENCVENMKKQAPAVWALICAANEMVMAKTYRLSNETTNHVENFMSIISKFNCGKRLNLHKGGSYQRRVMVAGLSQVTGQAWHSPAWLKCTNSSPGTIFKKYISMSEKAKVRRNLYIRRRLFQSKAKLAQPDKSYGPEAQDTVDLVNIGELDKICAEKLPEFNKTAEEIKAIEESTIGQHENDLYNIYRSERLTASQFGLICKRRQTTPSHNHVKQVLYKSNVMTKDMLYGQQNESVARMFFIENYNKTVRQAGLFIDAEFGFLGASPDGVVMNGDAILEIKCFPSLARTNQDIVTAINEKKNFPIIQKNGSLALNEKHSYYYQVQGQLRITKRTKCYFVCFIKPSLPITVIEVYRNDKFIEDMIPKLVHFYKNSILPEIVLRRIPKGAKCIDLH